MKHKGVQGGNSNSGILSRTLFCFALLILAVGASAQVEWTDCAGEKQTCIFDGYKAVRFGANDSYAYGNYENQVLCSNRIFGDPAPGVAKRCSYRDPDNLPPQVTAPGDQQHPQGSAVELQIVATDAAGDVLTFSATGLPGGTTIAPDTGLITGQLDAAGTYAVEINVQDDKGLSAVANFTWYVAEIDPSWTYCANEGGLCSFTGTAEVRFGANGSYSSGVFENQVNCSTTVFGDPIEGVAKTCSYRAPDDVPPVVSHPGNQSSAVGENVSLQIDATDPDGDPLVYSASGLPDGLFIELDTGLITGQPTTESSYNVEVVVDDGSSLSSTTFTWSVWLDSPEWVYCAAEDETCSFSGFMQVRFGASGTFAYGVFENQVACSTDVFGDPIEGTVKTCSYRALDNYPPVVTSPGNQVAVAGSNVSIPVAASDSDGDTLTYSASGLPEGLTMASATGVISGVTTAEGSYSIDVQAADPSGATGSTTFQLDVVPAGQEWLFCANEGQTCSFEGTTDVRFGADGTWAVGQYTGSVLCSNQVFGDPLPEVVKHCEYRRDVVPLSVENPGDRSGYVGKTVSLQLVAEGSEGTPTFQASSLPPGLTMDAVSGLISGQLTTEGQYNVQVDVSNGVGESVTVNWVWTVISAPADAQAQTSSGLYYDISGGTSRLWAVNPDNDTVTVFDTASDTRLTEFAVGKAPQSLAPVGDEIWVVNRDDASVSIIDRASYALLDVLPLPVASQPHAVLADPTAITDVYVSLSATGELVKLDAVIRQEVGRLAVGPNVRGLAIDASGNTLYASRFITPPVPGEHTESPVTEQNGETYGGEVVAVDLAGFTAQSTIVLQHSDALDTRTSGRGIPNYLGPMTIAPDGSAGWVPSKQDNIKRGVARDGFNLNHENTVRAVSSKIDLGSMTEVLSERADLDDASVASAAVFHPAGTFLFVSLETSREVAVLNVVTGEELPRIPVGIAPQDLAISPDGNFLYVHNFMDRTVTKHDVGSLINNTEEDAPALATYSLVAQENLPANVLLGKQFFYDAADPRLAREKYLSCASCHNDGGQDGRVWDMTGMGEGLRNTIALKGSGVGHGMLHWSGNFDEVQDFEGQIRNLAEGAGLMDDTHFFDGTRSQPLGDTKAGLSADLDALAVYLQSLDSFAQSPYRESNGAMTADALEGRMLFSEKGCSGCHAGTAFTNSADATLHDVGTITALSGSRLGETLTGLDTPSLRGAWESAPYLHDGSAPDLETAMQKHTQISLNTDEIAALVAYIRQIDDRENDAPDVSAWTECAAENQVCQFEGIREVRYGANGTYSTGVFNGGVNCSNAVFGDPIAGVVKTCSYRTSGNTPPYIFAPGLKFSYLNDAVAFQLNVVDPEGEALTYSAQGLPANWSIDPATGNITGTADTVGYYALTITVADSEGATATASFNWAVIDPSDPDSEWLFCANEKQFCSFSGTREVRFGADGVYNYGLFENGVSCRTTVFSDPLPGQVKACYFRVGGNSAPTIASVDDQGNAPGDVVQLALQGSDVDGDTLTYSATGLPEGLAIDADTGVVSGQLPATEGEFAITVVAADPNGATGSTTFNWVVSSTFDSNANWQFCANENEQCVFTGIAQVRFGANTSYASGVFDSGVNCSTSVFGDPINGVAKTCQYRVAGNNPPYIENPGQKVGGVNAPISITLTVIDPEGDALTFNASGLPDGLSIDTATGEISGTPALEGQYQVSFSATDAQAAANSLTFGITVLGEDEVGDGWVACANEGDVCSFPGEKRIRYGANGQYFYEFGYDSINCTSNIFGGDPAPGMVKSCFYQLDQDTGWTQCADDGQYCPFSGPRLVRYGAQMAFNYMVAIDGVDCNGETFGDPLGFVQKRCEVLNIDDPAPYSTYPQAEVEDNWVYCSPGGMTCHFDGTKQVRFVYNDEFVEITATDTVACNEETFGQGFVNGSHEHCEVQLNRGIHGEWSHVQLWPVIPVHASLMPDGRVLAHNATDDDLYTGYADVTLWDPLAHSFGVLSSNESTFAAQSSEMFCSGFDLLPDGSMLLSGSEPNVGGNDNRNANRYDFRSERFSRVSDNQYYRYYPSVAAMPSGDMVSFAGTLNEAPLEVYKFDGSWDALQNTSTWLNDFSYYAWGQAAPNGQLFYPGPVQEMRYFDLTGEGQELSAGTRDALDRDYGSYALYDIGKMLITGGAKPATDTAVLIDINGPSPVVTQGQPMGMPRRHANLTILADGTLLETGGHTGTTHQQFEPDKAVYSAELWSPATGEWTTMASMKKYRLYHSVAVLLPDGRVMSGGTGYPFDTPYNQQTAEIFSPPYLFNEDGSLATRPVIADAPVSVGYEHAFTVDVNSQLPVEKVHLIKLGTVTHHQNFGQRLVPLEFTQSGDSLDITSPESANVAPPGYYMLFVVDSAGTPSVAKFVQVLPYATVSLMAGGNNFLLDIAGGSMAPGASAAAAPNDNNLSQMWSLIPTDSGYFKLVSRASGYVLTQQGSQAVLSSDTNAASQQWRFVAASDGYYLLESRLDGAMLSANGGTVATSLTADTSTDWQLVPVGDINLLVEEDGKLLDGSDNVSTVAEVGQIDHTGEMSQVWYFEPAGDGYSVIRTREGSLALTLGNDGAGPSIARTPYTGDTSQHWRLVVNDSGSFRIEARNTMQTLTIGSGSEPEVYADYDFGNAAGQSWRLAPAVSGQPFNVSEGGGQILYRASVMGSGWDTWITNGQTTGADNLASALQALQVSVNGVRNNLSVEYQVYSATDGWSAWASDGATAGVTGQAIHGIRANLSGQTQGCSLAYRTYAAGAGWGSWVGAGSLSGNEGGGPAVNGAEFTLSCLDGENSQQIASGKLSVAPNNSDINFSAFEGDAFILENNSSAGIRLVKAELNLGAAFLPDLLFDPQGTAGDTAAACFASASGASLTGLKSIVDPCADPFSVARDGGFEVITLEFDDFDPGESLSFGADIDPSSIKGAEFEVDSGSVSGFELSGATVALYFSDGSVVANELYTDGSAAGSQSCIASDSMPAPTVTVAGLGGLPQTVSTPAQTLNITAQPNSQVRVVVTEGALFGDNGFDIDPFEANSVVMITEHLVAIDGSGNGQLNINLTHANGLTAPGYNHIMAAQVQGAACTGRVNHVGVIHYLP